MALSECQCFLDSDRTHNPGSGKNELIQTRRWADVVEVEIATFEWVNWWNKSRLHQSLDYRTPAEVESEFWSKSSAQDIMEIKGHMPRNKTRGTSVRMRSRQTQTSRTARKTANEPRSQSHPSRSLTSDRKVTSQDVTPKHIILKADAA